MHGNKQQDQREWVLNQFRSGKQRVLVATDLASRGIGPLLSTSQALCLRTTDISDIGVVINFDFPKNTEDYVHRIGRTARADATGVSHTFFGPGNAKLARPLIRELEETQQ